MIFQQSLPYGFLLGQMPSLNPSFPALRTDRKVSVGERQSPLAGGRPAELCLHTGGIAAVEVGTHRDLQKQCGIITTRSCHIINVKLSHA